MSRKYRFIASIVAAALMLVCAVPPRTGSAQGAAFSAMQKLEAADDLSRAGKQGKAYMAYLALLKDYPTWWLPTVKAAVTAQALGLPRETVIAYLDRTLHLSPVGPYLPFVRSLVDGEDPRTRAEPPAYTFGRAVWVDRANRLGLHRAMLLESQGRTQAAEAEYRAILARTPLCATARWRLASLLSSDGRVREADRILEEGAGASLFPPRWKAAVGQDGEPRSGKDYSAPRPKAEITY